MRVGVRKTEARSLRHMLGCLQQGVSGICSRSSNRSTEVRCMVNTIIPLYSLNSNYSQYVVIDYLQNLKLLKSLIPPSLFMLSVDAHNSYLKMRSK